MAMWLGFQLRMLMVQGPRSETHWWQNSAHGYCAMLQSLYHNPSIVSIWQIMLKGMLNTQSSSSLLGAKPVQQDTVSSYQHPLPTGINFPKLGHLIKPLIFNTVNSILSWNIYRTPAWPEPKIQPGPYHEKKSQWAHNIKMMSYQRQCDVITSHRRWYDVILMCARWECLLDICKWRISRPAKPNKPEKSLLLYVGTCIIIIPVTL